MAVSSTTVPYGDNKTMNLANALDRIYSDAFPIASYPVPRAYQNNVDFVYDSKTGVYTATVDAAGANKSKFSINVTGNTLTVSYQQTQGFRCKSFTYNFSLGKSTVVSETASYVDGVLTVSITTAAPTSNTRTITVN